jgi:hypothetical protein
MQAKHNVIFMAGILAAACLAVTILPAGCQSSSSSRVCNAQAGGVCPICGSETRTQPLTGLKFTTCVCPVCKQVSKIDPETLEKLQDVFGYLPEFRATVCEGCGAVVRECATCRQARAQKG